MLENQLFRKLGCLLSRSLWAAMATEAAPSTTPPSPPPPRNQKAGLIGLLWVSRWKRGTTRGAACRAPPEAAAFPPARWGEGSGRLGLP